MSFDILQKSALGIGIIVAVLLLLVIGKMTISGYFTVVSKTKKNVNKIKTIKKVVMNIYKITVIFIGVTIFLDAVLGIDTTSIITVAGVSGIAVGFASQTLIKDLLSGVMLLMEDNLTIGDDIKIGVYRGLVEDITLRSITLRGGDGVLNIIPNNTIKDFSNYSR